MDKLDQVVSCNTKLTINDECKIAKQMHTTGMYHLVAPTLQRCVIVLAMTCIFGIGFAFLIPPIGSVSGTLFIIVPLSVLIGLSSLWSP